MAERAKKEGEEFDLLGQIRGRPITWNGHAVYGFLKSPDRENLFTGRKQYKWKGTKVISRTDQEGESRLTSRSPGKYSLHTASSILENTKQLLHHYASPIPEYEGMHLCNKFHSLIGYWLSHIRTSKREETKQRVIRHRI